MTSQRSIVGKNHTISDLTVMRDMCVGQEITVVANDSYISNRGGPVHRDEFAETIVIPDFQVSRFAAILQVLGLLADRTECVEPIASPNLTRPTNRNVML